MNIRGIQPKDYETFPGAELSIAGVPPSLREIVGSAETLREGLEIHVAWQPDEIDLATLAHGGTVWLSVLGGLPPHRLEVRP